MHGHLNVKKKIILSYTLELDTFVKNSNAKILAAVQYLSWHL